MKKILAIAALLSLSAGVAYATTWAYATGGTFTFGGESGMTLNFKPSANVGMAYDGGGTTTKGVTYVVGAYHAQGNKLFGGSSVDTNIFYKDITAPGVGTALTNQDLPSVPNASAPTAFGTGSWTASK